MKTILIICIALADTTGAAAQKYGRHSYYRPRVRTQIGVGIGYSLLYSPYAYPYYDGTIYRRPTRLENEIADIKAEYNDKIWSARHDKSLSRSKRKKEVHDLKSERDKAIRDTEYNYHRR